MKTVGQIIDEIDRLVDAYTVNILNPDRAPHLRDQELHRRRELVLLRRFITESDGVKRGTKE